jgi:hypothetical protein
MPKYSKPIFTIGLPRHCTEADMAEMRIALTNKLTDYYVLVYLSNLEEAKFEAFYEKDFNKVKYEELKQIIIDNLPKKLNG